jgi:sulfite oxidase
MAGGATFAQSTPKREMLVHNRQQEGFEMTLSGFPRDGKTNWLTPIDQFFIRSHHYTPKVELASWKLDVGGPAAGSLSLPMDELKKMPAVDLVAVLECAGNGRGFYQPSMPGLQWGHGSVGNARWRGVRLAEVLKRAGVKPGAKHVLFDGADVPVGKQPEFQRTIPLAKAMEPNTLLAYEMNGETLPVSHGFPLRVIVPGWAGDSWVKWVTRVEVLDQEFDGFFMKTGYRHPGRGVQPGIAVKPEEMRPVEEIQIKSMVVSAGPVAYGVAYSGETPVARVEVSSDNGRSWKPAKITSAKTPFGWVTWEYAWQPPQGFYTLAARAFDAKGRTQPITQEWNPSGYQWNAVHTAANAPAAGGGAGMTMPAGYREACLTCHGEEPIRGQKLTRTQWEAEVGKMERWGAVVKPEWREAILNYLSAIAPPR